MVKRHSWSGERFWVKIIEKKLYPPGAIALPRGVKTLIKNKDFKGKKVLDHGCGTGRFGKLVQDKGADVIGIDVSEKILRTAKKYIAIKKFDGLNIPFDDDTFDYVLSFMVFMVIKDLDKVLSEIHRVLKPKGRLFFGIVHPHAEKWNTKTGLTFSDKSTYNKIGKRKWIFNLTDGSRFDEGYIHRPLEYYVKMLSKFFLVKKLLEPQLPFKYYKNREYAKREYLLGEAINK